MISVLYTIILITNFKLIEMCIKSSPQREGSEKRGTPCGFHIVCYFRIEKGYIKGVFYIKYSKD